MPKTRMADGTNTLSDIGLRVLALMKALDYKQVGFARLIGVGQPALNNYIKGLRRPDIDVATRIHMRTGATLDWLYLGDRSGLPAKLLEILPDLSDPSRRNEYRQNG